MINLFKLFNLFKNLFVRKSACAAKPEENVQPRPTPKVRGKGRLETSKHRGFNPGSFGKSKYHE